MDPFARKMILGSVAFGTAMLLMAGAASLIYFHNRPRCSEAALSETTSPDGQWTAAVMERRCGEESPFFIHVNLRPAGQHVQPGYLSGRAEEGEVFLAEEDTQDTPLTLEWTAPGQLTIRCPTCRASSVQKRDEHWGPAAVRYQLQR